MDAYQSLSNRVASMEELLMRNESNMAVVLQRIRALEEYTSSLEGRNRDVVAAKSEGMTSRLEQVANACNGRVDVLQGDLHRQGANIRVLEEQIQGAVNAIEQKINGDIATCYQRIQGSETSLLGTVRNLDGALHAQSTALKTVEQALRGDIATAQQNFSGEVAAVRQRVDALEASLRSTVGELGRALSGEIKTVSETLHSQLQSSNGAVNVAVTGLDQKIQTGLSSLQEMLAREIAVNRHSISSLDTSMRDALKDLHASLASDVAALLSRMQAEEANTKLGHQQLHAELSSLRQQMEGVDSNWRSSVTDLAGKVQDGFLNVRSQQASLETALQKDVAQTNTRVDQVEREVRHSAEGFSHALQSRLASLEVMREDIIRTRGALNSEHEERLRLREELRTFSTLAERSVVQLQSAMEAMVRSAHSDLMERMKPLNAYRSEIYTAVTAAINKLWNEARDTFMSQRDVRAIQDQIEVLDNAVRSEVALLAERSRMLESRAEEQERSLVPAAAATAPLNAGNGALVPMNTAVELNNVWDELRTLQKKMSASKDDVTAMLESSRREVLDSTLDVVKKNGEEFRNMLSRMEGDIRAVVPSLKKSPAVKGEPARYESAEKGEKKVSQPKKTIIRVSRGGVANDESARGTVSQGERPVRVTQAASTPHTVAIGPLEVQRPASTGILLAAAPNDSVKALPPLRGHVPQSSTHKSPSR
ncbi:hypothetical protein ERJ75_000217400 [Trypanosoma vivax]|uniref:Uncharacterized protein n=1 Tax=Trypanosoma vivax (strain Y486) TaxID=1055687 RepID=G0U9R5_TRYVY|nr:hypothetical protein TRVL_04307 [Trypanosoma vivax]KAH8619162.1 hypothetical protein ERJ75_000217400 [Trypanosoma vivax]CCC52546.1 conserved hypothetical protein [Trypanosoma vivax Y486]